MKCILCRANLTKGNVNHIVDLGEGIIIIKNVPANICEQCGEYYLDTKRALELETMIDEIKKNKAEVLILSRKIGLVKSEIDFLNKENKARKAIDAYRLGEMGALEFIDDLIKNIDKNNEGLSYEI